MQDEHGIQSTGAARPEIEEECKRAGWRALSYLLLGMCLTGALWAAVSFKYC